MSGTEDEADRDIRNDSTGTARSRVEPHSGVPLHEVDAPSPRDHLQSAARSPRFVSIRAFYDHWIGDRLKFLLFLISLLTDFSVFVVVFAVLQFAHFFVHHLVERAHGFVHFHPYP